MLNGETKRKIQSLRDTLVGKLPAPTDQVKQITLGLIYKFMSDIDMENVDVLGGKSFFTGEYEKYSWDHILDPSISSYERVMLYSEGLDKMNFNPNIPELFRNIFKGAYLPYKDPAILSSFLKEINDGFKYEHSEDLGDAFEFLLSIMSTQGAAGQFRTPRHIIDFIVKVVEPNKNDRTLDPACGTAGFLISAYKYILENNKVSDSDKPGSGLTLTEKNKLTENFVGYDISPDMVSLSLVNMYLHNFANPNIKEYDTLTSEDLWDNDFDCIMANPPFMTPKGGIKPHKRFAIRANRSELLFVDYIAEHLLPNGKAGVIVPEGIIFQSSNAYKALRKMLVEGSYIYAVVSLPAGVFQPYSGVKTSVLFMDKVLAGKTDNILFVKVENDGFDLGAQRKDIDKNDLPLALDLILKYKTSIIKNEKLKSKEDDEKILNIVKKEKIREGGDYNLTGDRYMQSLYVINSKRPVIKLEEIFEISKGKKMENTNIPLENSKPYIVIDNLRFNKYTNFTTEKNGLDCNETDLLIIWDGANAGLVGSGLKGFVGSTCARLRLKIDANSKYLEYIIKSLFTDLNNNTNGMAVPHLSKDYFLNIKIPLPPTEIQQEIVEELNEYQKIIDGARQVVENYKPRIEIDPNWEIIELSNQELFYIESGGTPDSNKNEYWNGDIPWITLVDLPPKNFVTFIYDTIRKISQKGLKSSSAKIIPKESILISTRATIGRIAVNMIDLATNQGFKNIIIKDKSKINYKFIAFIMTKKIDDMLTLASGSTFKEISKTNLGRIRIPKPSINEQNSIVYKIEEELKMIETNKNLIERFEQKIKDKINLIW